MLTAQRSDSALDTGDHAESFTPLDLSPEAKLKRIIKMRPFILDSSFLQGAIDRQLTTDAMMKHEIQSLIVAAHGTTLVDESVLALKGVDMYAVSALYDEVVDGRPVVSSLPLGLRSLPKVSILNLIFEVDVCLEDAVFPLHEVARSRFEVFRAQVSPMGEFMVSLRDCVRAWSRPETQERLLGFVEFLGSLPAHLRPTGLLCSDATGNVAPWELTDFVAAVRNSMLRSAWEDGHWLVHLENSEMNVLEALASGCTGLWGPSAAAEHSTVEVLLQLARLGNASVVDMYNVSAEDEAPADPDASPTHALCACEGLDEIWDIETQLEFLQTAHDELTEADIEGTHALRATHTLDLSWHEPISA